MPRRPRTLAAMFLDSLGVPSPPFHPAPHAPPSPVQTIRRRGFLRPGPRLTVLHALAVLGVPIAKAAPTYFHGLARPSMLSRRVSERVVGGDEYLYETAREAYLRRAKEIHPDHGGTGDGMAALNRAMDLIERRYGH